MKGLTIETYGDTIADLYDTFHPIPADAAVALLAELAEGGPVLELGVGTGRVAIPLADRGIAVTGVDVSDAMVAQLRAKPGGEQVRVVKGDFSDVVAGEGFALAFVVFNTFFALTTQEAQKRCFQTVAKQLRPGGKFLLEVFVPDPRRFVDGQALRTGGLGVSHVVLEATRYDTLTQTVDAQLVRITPDGVRLIPLSLRYAWPAELDLMAELAGCRLLHRWASFAKVPFTSSSIQHVSVYEKVC